ncbi:hypothetical protein ABW19_dt0201857 [Dactylella cylindrospora]|nr:hypothetical protein ABW19_dt0201857 [Dactylella cylindrospora]
MSEREYGFVTSIFSFGGLLGAITAGSITDRYGRKKTALFNCAGFIVGPAFMTLATDITTLSIGRVIVGVSAGSSVVVGPLYIHNVAPPEHAGAFGASTQVIINFGILVAQSLGLFLSTVPYWRLILAIGGFIGLAQLLLLPFCVESPKWLASTGNLPLARRSLARLRGRLDIEDEIFAINAGREASDEGDTAPDQRLLSTADDDHTEKVSLYSFLTDAEHRPQMIAIVGIMIAQQFMGINVIVMYGVSILKDIIPTGAALINVIVSLLNLFVTAIAARMIDKVGRKPPLLFSIAGMGFFSLLLGIGIVFRVQLLSGVSTLLFVSSFAIGLGPLPFMIASELVDHKAVGAAQSIGLTTNWLATFAVAYGFPSLRLILGNGQVFFIFTTLSIVFFVFVSKCIPETKGKTVDEVWGRTRRVD